MNEKIVCHKNKKTGNIVVYGINRCKIDEASFISKSTKRIKFKRICRDCGQQEEVKQGEDFGPAKNIQPLVNKRR